MPRPSPATPSPPETSQVFRPLQYLGSKLRSLDAIGAKALELVGPGARVLDPFCGSTVVAQRLADLGMQVHASDAFEFSASAGRAALGVGRTDQGADAVLSILASPTPLRGMDTWVQRERDAVARGDGPALLEISRSVPQVWRGSGAPDPRRALAASHYAGTYFGVWQALRVDALRQALEHLVGWERDVAQTALCSAMSACAYSAGKHFAQPHKLSRDKDLGFHARRALSDRAIDLDTVFRQAVLALAARSSRADHGHSAVCALVEELPAAPAVDLVYADPPYTAQQYSRFYHVPEVIHAYRPPTLQLHRGSITAGLYPTGRFASDFCRKSTAPAAFRRLVQLCAARGAQLLLSYSGARGNTGNERMVTLPWLVQLLEGFGPLTLHELDHDYRQFNRTDHAVSQRRDPEFLLHCRVRPC